MKRILVVAALLIQLVGAGAALAAVNVDFSVMDGINHPTQQDITVPNSLTLNGVTFIYDNFGSSADSATVDALGILGTTGGALDFVFSAPATGLNMSFSLFPISADASDGLVISFSNGDDVTVPAIFDSNSGSAFGSLAYSGSAFNQASMFFSLDAPLFTVDAVSYEPATASVPEPATLLLLAAGLLGLGGSRRFMRKQGRNHFGFSAIA